MKFTIDTQTLKSALDKIQKITKDKSRLGVTDSVKIQANADVNDGEISVMAYNPDTISISRLRAQVETPGTMVANSERLFELVKVCQDQDITIECDGRLMTVSYSTGSPESLFRSESRFSLATSDPELYPDAPETADRSHIVILEKAAVLKNMIKACLSAPATRGETRAAFKGACLELFPSRKEIRLASTNGSRLVYVDSPLSIVEPQGEDEAPKPILVPKASLDEIQKAFNDNADIVLGITEKFLVLIQDNEEVNIRLLDGEFPPYEVPTSTEGMTEINVDAGVFAASLSRANLVLNPDNVGTSFVFSRDALKIKHTHPGVGTFEEQMAIQYDGPDARLFMNPTALLKAVKAIDAQDLLLFVAPNSPKIIIKPRDESSPLYALMGMQES